MQNEFLTSRSRTLDTLRCARSRWLLHEVNGTGFELVKQAVPLVAGIAVHHGLSVALAGSGEEAAVCEAVLQYERLVEGRGLEISDLESQSHTFQEQRALTEALVRLGVRKVIPPILAMYDVLAVEMLDKRPLVSTPDLSVVWRSVTDALLQKKDDGDLYLLSWKTCASLPKDNDARIDMQGVSEAWAMQDRLSAFPLGKQRIRGVQMAFLVKGMRRQASKEMTVSELTPEQIAAGFKLYRNDSPLIYGYADASSMMIPAPLFWTKDYHCTTPHPMRKSKWYPDGRCDTPGRLHKRGDEFTSFAAWKQDGGVKAWMDLLDSGLDPGAGDPYAQTWALPVPNFRTVEQQRDWFEQTRAREEAISQNLLRVRSLESQLNENPEDPDLQESFRTLLNQTFPQTTDVCNHWFGRNCPASQICWGPPNIQSDPLSSGLYQIKTQYHEAALEDLTLLEES
jgi:hypothetical protein